MVNSQHLRMLFKVIVVLSVLKCGSSNIFYPARHSFPFNEEANVIPGQIQHHLQPQEVSQTLVPPEPSAAFDTHSGADYSSADDRRFLPSDHQASDSFRSVGRHPSAQHTKKFNAPHLASPFSKIEHKTVVQTSLAHPPTSAYIPPPLQSTPITITDNFDIGSHPVFPSRHEHTRIDQSFEHRPSHHIAPSRTEFQLSLPTGSSRRQFDRNFVPHSLRSGATSGTAHGLSKPSNSAHEPFIRNSRPHSSRPIVSSDPVTDLSAPNGSKQNPFDTNFRRMQTQRPNISFNPFPGSSSSNVPNKEPFNKNFILQPPSAQGPFGHHSRLDSSTTQYRNQDALGRYNFGYDGDSSSRHETKDADGTVRGSYSYLDSFGKIQSQNYVADRNGFRVLGTNLPVGPSRKKRSAGNFPASTGPLWYHQPWENDIQNFGYSFATFHPDRFPYGDSYGSSFDVIW